MKYEENVDLKKLNTYHIGGSAKYLIKPNDLEELMNVLNELNNKILSIIFSVVVRMFYSQMKILMVLLLNLIN